MKFQHNVAFEKAINTLSEKLSVADYDSKFSWDELKSLCKAGVDLSRKDLYYILSKVNKLLMQNNQRALVSIQGFGKRILKPNEHSTVARKEAKKSARIYRKAGQIINATNLDGLNSDERLRVIEDANRWRTLEMFQNEILKKPTLQHKSEVEKKALLFDMMKIFGEK